ncbi:MAG: DNA polymerase III subunit chi [Bdellovibrionales bacterium]
MTEVRFYHLTRSTLEQALPTLLEKTIERGWHAVVMTDSDERAEHLTQFLWTYRSDNFLPHGCKKDGRAEKQPLWITGADENPNDASVLFLIHGAASDHVGDYDLVCEVFDGQQDQAVEEARRRWKVYKEQGYKISYWQQGPKGWESVGG